MTATAPAGTLAYGVATLARADQDGPVLFTASTENVNRFGFRLNHNHWRLGNFQANPVVLLNHRADQLPIGTADASLDGFARTLRAAVTFDRGDPTAREVERKTRAGVLRAMSVGWGFVQADGSPIADWWKLRPPDIWDAWYDLEELSIVTVPGDPGAVRAQQSRAAGRWLSGAQPARPYRPGGSCARCRDTWWECRCEGSR